MKYIQRQDGEGWEVRNRIPFRVSCCDCGLVHDLVIVAPGKRKGALIGIAAKRNEKATGQKRRHKNAGRGVLPELEHGLAGEASSLGSDRTAPPLSNERPAEIYKRKTK